VELAVGLPIGTGEGETYASTTIEVPPGATVLAFTDGLVERRKESIDVGLDRLREAAAERDAPLDDLLGEVIGRLTPDGSEDDTAVLGLRWRN
jgi:serine phosphatase RsbU (regulator of sigma subunit)